MCEPRHCRNTGWTTAASRRSSPSTGWRRTSISWSTSKFVTRPAVSDRLRHAEAGAEPVRDPRETGESPGFRHVGGSERKLAAGTHTSMAMRHTQQDDRRAAAQLASEHGPQVAAASMLRGGPSVDRRKKAFADGGGSRRRETYFPETKILNSLNFRQIRPRRSIRPRGLQETSTPRRRAQPNQDRGASHQLRPRRTPSPTLSEGP